MACCMFLGRSKRECGIKSFRAIALVTSRLSGLHIVCMEDTNLPADAYQLHDSKTLFEKPK